MKAERTATLRADLALVGISTIWGFTFPAIQLALRDAAPLTFISLRFGLAAVALAVCFRKRALRAACSGWLSGLILGLCLAAGTALQTFGLLYTTASKSAFITALYVVLVPLITLAAVRVRLRLSSVAAVLLAAAGLYELTAPRGGLNTGDLLTLGCALAFALHIIVAEAATPRHDPVMLTFYQVLTTAVISSAAMLVSETPRFAITPWTVAALAVTSLLATALAFAVQMWAQRETSGTHAAVIFTAEPVFAAIFARLIQQERLGWHGLAGGASIVAGILVSEIGARRPAKREG
jgi:drug/metabolite transporter (DMT)-like permease